MGGAPGRDQARLGIIGNGDRNGRGSGGLKDRDAGLRRRCGIDAKQAEPAALGRGQCIGLRAGILWIDRVQLDFDQLKPVCAA